MPGLSQKMGINIKLNYDVKFHQILPIFYRLWLYTNQNLSNNNFHIVYIQQLGYCFRSFDVYVNCEILAIPAKYDFKPYAYGFQKDSPFLPLFNYYLKEMKEKGSLKQIQTKYDPQPQFCPDFSGKPLGVGAVFTAFGVLFFGICAALILFCLEKILHVLGKFILSYDS